MGMIGNTLAQGLISGANIVDGTVDTPDLKDGAVTTAKITDANVTPAKLSTGAPSWDTSSNLTAQSTTSAVMVKARSTFGSAVFAADAPDNTKDIGLRVQVNGALKWLVGMPNNVADDNFSVFNANTSVDALKIDYSNNAITTAGVLGVGVAPSNAALHVKADWVSGHSTVKVQTSTSIASGGTVGYGTYDSDGTRLGYFYSNSTLTSIGSSASYPLVFETAGQERGRFSSDGKFTVGTSAPTAGKLNIAAGGAAGVPWYSGLNIGDSSNYLCFIQDGGVSRWRNTGTGGYQWFSSGGSALLTLSDAGSLSTGSYTYLHTGNISYLPTSYVAPDSALPSGSSQFQPFLVSGGSTANTGGDGCVIAWTWTSGGYGSQIYVDIDPTNIFGVRTRNSAGAWQSWRML